MIRRTASLRALMTALNGLFMDLASSPVLAGKPEAHKALPGLAPDPLQALQLSNYLIAIVLVFAVLALASWLLRRYTPGTGSGPIRIEACRSLGGKDRLMIVAVQQRRLLIGVGAAGIALLQDLNSEETRRDTAEEASATGAPVATQSWLQQALSSVVRS